MQFRLPLEKGKYEIMYNNGTIDILRHGELWRDATGDGFVHALLMSHIDLELELSEMKGKVDDKSAVLLRLDNLKSLLGELGSLNLEDYDILYGEIEALQQNILGNEEYISK